MTAAKHDAVVELRSWQYLSRILPGPQTGNLKHYRQRWRRKYPLESGLLALHYQTPRD